MNDETEYRAPAPASALLLGVAGLIPFFGLSLGVGLVGDPVLAERMTLAFVFYAAAILSFLGGVGWGLAMNETDAAQRGLAFGISIVPALIAWAGAFINVQNLDFTLAIFAAAFFVQGGWDFHLMQTRRAPRWFGRLRLGLTVAVLISIAVAWMMQPTLAGVGASL